MSVVFCVGKLAWPRINKGDDFVRIVFGPFAFWLIGFDFDWVMGELHERKEKS